jgi:hypothetical protein
MDEYVANVSVLGGPNYNRLTYNFMYKTVTKLGTRVNKYDLLKRARVSKHVTR